MSEKRITTEDLDYVARLARLRLDDAEKELLCPQLDSILDYVAKLNELDTASVEPMTHSVDVSNVFRSDEPRDSIERERVLGLAPRSEDGFYIVPKIIE